MAASDRSLIQESDVGLLEKIYKFRWKIISMQKAKKKIKKLKAKPDGGYRPLRREWLRELVSGSAHKEGRVGEEGFAMAYRIVTRALGSDRVREDLYNKLGTDERFTLAQMAKQYAREQHKPLAKDARARLTEDAQK